MKRRAQDMSNSGLRAASSAKPANWLIASLNSREPTQVRTFVPDLFPAVVRVLNPVIIETGRKLRWADQARALGMEPNGQLNGERLRLAYEEQTGLSGRMLQGALDDNVAAALGSVLSEYTKTPEDCFLAMWTGYSEVPKELIQVAPVVTLPPERNMHLLQGSLDQVLAPIVDFPEGRRSMRWWPADHAWCTGNDLYADSIYVAGSRKCIDALLNEKQLEAYEVSFTDRHPGIYA